MYPFYGGIRWWWGLLAKRVESSIKIDSQHMVFSAESVSAQNMSS
ncbi:hypothetical protein VCHA41O246_40046 [Vibrio chagasii]|nr:hypothetical protein VCHA41O246_40046 [Vibrio chagasii]